MLTGTMSAGATPKKIASENELGQKWDRCIADTILKTGTGVGLGVLFSLLLFKRRPWPVALGTGFGLGYAFSNCQHDFRRVDSVYLKPIKVDTSKQEPVATNSPAPSGDGSPKQPNSLTTETKS